MSQTLPGSLRRRAELKVAHGDLPSKASLDPIRLLHELQVHQIELELQNEDLLSANKELEALRMKYQALYELAPVGYLTLSTDGDVLELNAQAANMLGRDRQSIVSRPMRDHFLDRSLPQFDEFLRVAITSSIEQSVENLLLERLHSVPIYIRAEARSMELPGEDERVVLMAMMDISALKYAREDVISTLGTAKSRA